MKCRISERIEKPNSLATSKGTSYLCIMKPLKVVFFGTPDFAKESLRAIHESSHEVVGVVTQIDKAAGRGQKLTFSSVKSYALEQNLNLLQPEKLKNPEFLEEIRGLKADVFVVVAFRMMPKILFEIPPLGTFNLHASLLPDYRGAAPINYAIIGGEKRTGVTTFFINDRIDEGEILLQESTEILDSDNAGTLHDKLMGIGSELVVKTLDALSEGTLKSKKQAESENPKLAYKIFKEDQRIHWEESSKKIYDFIRGLSPYPSAFTQIAISGDIKGLKIYQGHFTVEEHNEEPGTLQISKSELKFATGDGYYFPTLLQLEGKKKMPLRDFLNGFQSFEDITKKPS